MERLSWNEYFMQMAFLISKRATCIRRAVGAVIVKDNKILATGYNGAPKGIEHCSEAGCYRIKNNIPSGQQLDQCLVPNTKIKLLNGTSPTIKDLMIEKEENLWCYSYDLENNQIVPGKIINVFKTQTVEKIYKITFDNNKSIKCTGEHKFLCRDGIYRKVKDLNEGISIMPLYFNRNSYEYFFNSKTINGGNILNEDTWLELICSTSTHIMVNEYFNIKKTGYDIHHKDENKYNNNPNNLEYILKGEHTKRHPITKEQQLKAAKAGAKVISDKWKNDKEFRKNQSKIISNNTKKQWQENEEYKELMKEQLKKNGKTTSKKYNKDPYAISRRRRGFVLRGMKNLYKKCGIRLTDENYSELRNKFIIKKSEGQSAPYIEKIYEFFDSVEDAFEYCLTYNHKIIKIEIIEEKTDVYDMTVDKYHNYLIDLEDNSGVFSHNCTGCHAEMNAIIQAAITGVNIAGATLYCTTFPCNICAKMIINCGIKKIYYVGDYNDQRSKDLFKQTNIEVIKLEAK